MLLILELKSRDLKLNTETSIAIAELGNRHTRGSARTTNARGRSTRGLTSEPVPSAIMTALLQLNIRKVLKKRGCNVYIHLKMEAMLVKSKVFISMHNLFM